MKTDALFKIFAAVTLCYLALLLIGKEEIAWFIKPLLLPWLLLGVWNSERFATKNTLLAALTFSWLGDIVLLFADQGERYFIIGLVLFLIAHLLYIALFVRQPKIVTGNTTGFYIGFVAIIGYLFTMLYVLYPTLGSLKIPVTVYAVVISAMLAMALKGGQTWSKPANHYIFAGAVCFVVSDSLLAFDKFHNPLPLASFSIMLTYLAAQFLIVFGILTLNKRQPIA